MNSDPDPGPRCKCGHGLHDHYLCGGNDTRCLHRSCTCERFKKPTQAQPEGEGHRHDHRGWHPDDEKRG